LFKSKNENAGERFMRSKIGWLSLGMCLGFMLGGIILFLLFKNPPEQVRKDDSKEILDFVIGEWTNPEPDSILVAGIIHRDKSGIFQLRKIPDTVRALASHIEAYCKIPKGVVIAQWILESKWGLCSLGAENYFGMTLAAVKKYMQQPKYVIQQDKRFVNGIAIPEIVRFARFKNIAECFNVYGQYIQGSKLYANAFKHSDQPEKFAMELAKHYAADPEYAIKLVTLMRRYKLE
jgi:hypothetical protein